MRSDLLHFDATAQAALVSLGEVTPVELVEAAIDAAERLEPELNTIVHRRFERALEEAASPDLPDGPFRGVPFVEKDLDGFAAGEPFWGGCRHLRDAGYVPDVSSVLHDRFVAAGFVTIGRTNTPELGLVPSTEPELTGPTHNPWDLDRSAGGSSGGSAAAVAARIVAAGHAGDGGGSIRIPASVCGLVGLKPTRGRVSLGPHIGEAWAGNVVRLAVTRSVRDTAAILGAVAGWVPGDPYQSPRPMFAWQWQAAPPDTPLRIGVTTTAPDPAVTTHPDVVAVVEQVGRLLAGMGHVVEPRQPEVWDDHDAGAALVGHFTTGIASWVAHDLAGFERLTGRPVTADEVEPATWMLAEMGRGISAVAYQDALAGMSAYSRRLAASWSGFDVLLCPVVPEGPWRLGEFRATPDNPLAGMLRATQIVPFTVPFNVSGQPAISVPGGWTDDGLPIGVQLVAAGGREDQLLALAAQIEQAQPWAKRLPPVCA